jgi:hypothetical protein
LGNYYNTKITKFLPIDPVEKRLQFHYSALVELMNTISQIQWCPGFIQRHKFEWAVLICEFTYNRQLRKMQIFAIEKAQNR